MTNHEKADLIIMLIAEVLLCIAVIIIMIKGSNKMLKSKYIPPMLGWPEVSGDKVPIVVRRRKIMVIIIVSIFLIGSVLAELYIFDYL